MDSAGLTLTVLDDDLQAFNAGALVRCLPCDRPFVLGDVGVALTIGVEELGYVCDSCAGRWSQPEVRRG